MSEPRTHEVLVLSGPAGPSLYVNQYRIAGPKPWGGGTILHTFHAADTDFIAAGVTPALAENAALVARLGRIEAAGWALLRTDDDQTVREWRAFRAALGATDD